MVRVFLILLLGSLAAPLIFLAIALAAPTGFNDLRGASTSTISVAFAGAWFYSSILTLTVGGLSWWVLHDRRIDGFGSYAAIAIISYAGIYLASAGSFAAFFPFLVGALFALANAILVRGAELLYRPSTMARSNTTPHTDARDAPAPAEASGARAGGRER